MPCRKAGATSIATACTEDAAVKAANDQMPDIILSDVILAAGTGPGAVRTILSTMGNVPIIFITGTSEACRPPPHRASYCISRSTLRA